MCSNKVYLIMKVIFAGNNLRGIECLKYLIKKKMNIPLVIGHPKKDTSSYYSSLKKISQRYKINYIAPKNINSFKVFKIIDQLKPDIMILVGYSNSILKRKIFSIPKYGTLNLHASMLPYYRGGSPLNWAIINNEKKIGISIILVDEGIDTGPIISQLKNIRIRKNENINSLTHKINKKFKFLLFKTIKKIKSGKFSLKYQKKNIGSYFPKRSKIDGLIDFKKHDAHQVERMVRALLPPFPGAFFFYNRKEIKIINAFVKKGSSKPNVGEIILAKNSMLHIQTKKNILCINSFLVNNKKNKKLKFKVGYKFN